MTYHTLTQIENTILQSAVGLQMSCPFPGMFSHEIQTDCKNESKRKSKSQQARKNQNWNSDNQPPMWAAI